MGLLYLYLAAWIVGGVLLGARILLTHREPAATTDVEPVPELGGRPLVLGAAALIGFGLFGLLAEGLGLLPGPWTAASAAAGSALFVGVTFVLRARLQTGAG